VVNPDEFPFMLSLQWFGNHICGASLIDDTHAVTAGTNSNVEYTSDLYYSSHFWLNLKF
jgi:hypothetical protein